MKDQPENLFPSKTKDYLVTQEDFELRYRSDYKLLETYPKPSPGDLPRYYESEKYVSHTDAKKGWFHFLYQSVKKYSIRRKVSLLASQKPKKGKLLDIGAGTGAFLEAALNDGWEGVGVEPNEKARSLAKQKGLDCFASLDAIDAIQFDIVTLWHVLEHMPNIEQTVQKITSLVADEGFAIIAVPNFKSLDAKYYKNYWAGYDVPRHLWHFSQESIPLLFSDFELIATKPMVFDSFYVSLLSERYKKNRLSIISAFFVGLWSNIAAWHTGEYSSLIYILNKKN
jgi:SAM-dependent methyltransferase